MYVIRYASEIAVLSQFCLLVYVVSLRLGQGGSCGRGV